MLSSQATNIFFRGVGIPPTSVIEYVSIVRSSLISYNDILFAYHKGKEDFKVIQLNLFAYHKGKDGFRVILLKLVQ